MMEATEQAGSDNVRGRMDDHDLLIRLNTLMEVSMRSQQDTQRTLTERFLQADQRHEMLQQRVEQLASRINIVWGICVAVSVCIPLIFTAFSKH